MIRSADPGRPVTASIADTGTWQNFYRDADIDFIQVHPYPPSARLDRTVVEEVRNYLDKYKKPVLIGESGLNAESPEKYPENAANRRTARHMGGSRLGRHERARPILGGQLRAVLPQAGHALDG